jgi:hypothetical protein
MKIYSHGRGKNFELLNNSLHEFLDLTPIMLLIIVFFYVNIFLLFDELPQKSILYLIFWLIRKQTQKIKASAVNNKKVQFHQTQRWQWLPTYQGESLLMPLVPTLPPINFHQPSTTFI